MFGSVGKKAFWLIVAVAALFGGNVISGQTPGTGNPNPQLPARPLLQDIQIAPIGAATPDPNGNLVKKTGSSQPAVVKANSFDPVLADVAIPGYTGILVETLDGKPVVESSSNEAFNPASNVKLATTYAVLKTFGPDYRFPTNVWTDGTIDHSTATLTGNIYVSGRDPIFGYEHAVDIADALNKAGIRNITGDLIVTDNFAMNYSKSVARSSESLFSTLDASKRSPAATRVWLNYLVSAGRMNEIQGIPGVTFTGHVFVQPIPSSLKLLFSHESAPMRDIIKATLCYSNNFLAERLGDMLGGA
ncbi:MAG: D-alanyl-D-alanine carboxypeptidase, partial [Pyrinomonadaceae bacterium]